MTDIYNEIENKLRAWLGDSTHTISGNPNDIVLLIWQIKDHGFRRLMFRNYPANPDWIEDKWRKKTGVICPQCGQEIQSLLKNHRISRTVVTGRPYIFCNCVRLQPSALPSLEFFTGNWAVVIDIYNAIVAAAIAAQTERTGEHAGSPANRRAISQPVGTGEVFQGRSKTT